MFNNLQCSFGVGGRELVDIDGNDDCSRACSHSGDESSGGENNGTLCAGLEEPSDPEHECGQKENFLAPEGVHAGGGDNGAK